MNKLSVIEKQWVLYDVGNSAFIMLVSTIIPIYFKNIATSAGISLADSTAYWGYAASIATIVIALVGPILGAMADHKNFKKRLFTAFMLLGVLGCAALAIPAYWGMFLAVFIIAKIGYSGSLIFYDSMLTDVTSDDRMDHLSSYGYAWGYLGSCIPFIICLGLILTTGITGIPTLLATQLAFLITAVWWLIMSLPLIKNHKQIYYVKEPHSLGNSFKKLKGTLEDIKKNKKVLYFLIAFFFYIDGVYTIIEMATSYGKDVGISDNNLLLALLLTQVVAFPFAVMFAKLSKKYRTEDLISVCIVGYFGISVFALQLDKASEFWFLAICVAIFQGAIQAFSRSYFARIIPKEHSNEYFGFFDIFGKGAAFTGTLLMGVITQMTGHSRYGVIIISVLILIGFIFFRKTAKIPVESNSLYV